LKLHNNVFICFSLPNSVLINVGIRKAMSERNLNEGQWEDRKQWSIDVRQRRKAF
jgi:hypothetical protein